MKSDLHIHTNSSDGKLNPQEILDLAHSKGLNTLCISDHDSIEGSEKMLQLNGTQGIKVIPGIELSADFNGREVHILGYFIDLNNAALKEHLKLINNLRIRRVNKMIEKLREFGFNINPDSIFEKYNSSCSIGRPHLANELVEKGYVKDFQTAFQRYLGDKKPAFVKKENLNYEIVIELIRVAGGLSFIAHPANYFRESSLLKFVNAGIDGIEVYHPSHSPNHVAKFKAFAAEHGLLISGGSDFHGYAEYDFSNIGRYFISDEELNAIKEKHKNKKLRNEKINQR